MTSICTEPRCPNLTKKGKCFTHKQQEQQEYRKHRPDDSFYRSPEWRKVRLEVLADSPYCCVCGAVANTVDHIKPLRERPDLALDRGNLRSMCKPCHEKRSVKDGQRWG